MTAKDEKKIDDSVNYEGEQQQQQEKVRHEIFFPACTEDYYLSVGKYGLGLVANRFIKKGSLVFEDSYEYLFTDVEDGDVLRFFNYEEANRQTLKAAKKKMKAGNSGRNKEESSPELLPPTWPLTREMLIRTHGVPKLEKDDDHNQGSGKISWQLEVPCMLANHSCDPNVIDESDDDYRGECRAARDIQKGEQLAFDYTFQFYDVGPFFSPCECGSKNCLGEMIGFKALSQERKDMIMPNVTKAITAMHEADIGVGPPAKHEQVVHRPRSFIKDSPNLKLVISSPSYACAPVKMVQTSDNTERYELVATKDIQQGKKVYEFFTEEWPKDDKGQPIPIDLVFAKKTFDNDLPEGTTVLADPAKVGRPKKDGSLNFSGFDLFVSHSDEPNMVYKHKSEYNGWHETYAARPIQKGDRITVDFNTIFWDRAVGDDDCKGFSYLTTPEQDELNHMSWLHVSRKQQEEQLKELENSTATNKKGKKKKKAPPVIPGEALSKYVRSCWEDYKKRKDVNDDDNVSTTSSGSSSSSSSSSSSNSSD